MTISSDSGRHRDRIDLPFATGCIRFNHDRKRSGPGGVLQLRRSPVGTSIDGVLGKVEQIMVRV